MKTKQINKLYLIYDSSEKFKENERTRAREEETELIIKIKNIYDDLIDFDFFSDEDYHY